MPETAKDDFDIRDGRHRYCACPECDATWGMGLVTKSYKLAVECGMCGHRGPEVSVADGPSNAADRQAFEAWNAQPGAYEVPRP